MARAEIFTLLPLDHYARIMAIHPDAFNQCINPAAPYPGDCPSVWYQRGWMDPDGQISGREDVAQAIATAEEMMANALGFWPAPLWTVADEQAWPRPARGRQVEYPPIRARWGQIIAGGQMALTIIDDSAAIVYSDADGDGVDEIATISITAAQMATAGASREEVAVYYEDETDAEWRITDLRITEDAVTGDVTIVGRRSQFLLQANWDIGNEYDLSVNANFETAVDVYRRYNDPSQPAQVVWDGGVSGCDATLCAPACQTSCLSIEDKRLGIVRAIPASYASGSWSLSSFSVARLPDKVRLWYQSGLGLTNRLQVQPTIAEAIARLANTYLPEKPCGCQQTMYRWQRDREEQDINTYDSALCMSAFGSTMKGALFAWSVVKRLQPLASGSALT